MVRYKIKVIALTLIIYLTAAFITYILTNFNVYIIFAFWLILAVFFILNIFQQIKTK